MEGKVKTPNYGQFLLNSGHLKLKLKLAGNRTSKVRVRLSRTYTSLHFQEEDFDLFGLLTGNKLFPRPTRLGLTYIECEYLLVPVPIR